MSQYVKVRCDVLDDVRPSLFKKMIEGIDVETAHGKYGLDTTKKHVEWYGREQDEVDCVLTRDGKPLSIGFKFTSHNEKLRLTVCGDFWNTGLDEEKFPNQLKQTYQVLHLTEVVHKGKVTQKPRLRKDGKIVFRVAA